MTVNFELAMLENIAGTVIVDKDLKIVFINTSAVILLKTPSNQALGQPLSSVLFPSSKQRAAMHDSYMRGVFNIGLKDQQTMAGRIVNYNDRKLNISLVLVGDHCVAYIEDKTELVETKAKLEAKPDPSHAIVLKTSDIRLKIINLLVGIIVGLVISSTIVGSLGHKEQARVLDSILAGFVGSFSSCVGFFFKDDKDK